jgi:hypothetical protein
MKKLTITLAVVALFFTGSAFALDPVSVSSNVKAVFAKDFAKAEKVTWSKNSGFYFDSFMLENKAVSAAYDEKGELTGTSRVLSASELPLNISLAIAKRYAGYDISPTFTEVTFNGETTYAFTATNNKQHLEINSDNNANFTVASKVKK